MDAPHPDRLLLMASVRNRLVEQHVRGHSALAAFRLVTAPTTTMQSSSTTNSNTQGPTASKSTSASLSPDEAAARKARMNADLISIFKRPCPPETTSSIKGIGLYTHIEGAATLTPDGRHTEKDPEFLPLREFETGEVRESISEDLKEVWEMMSNAIREEEQLIGKTQLGLAGLKKRYGGFDAPDSPLGEQDEHFAGQNDMSDAARRELLKAALARLVVSNGDVVMAGTDSERGRKSTRHADFYREDPRMRGR